jgi:hypothetical protein
MLARLIWPYRCERCSDLSEGDLWPRPRLHSIRVPSQVTDNIPKGPRAAARGSAPACTHEMTFHNPFPLCEQIGRARYSATARVDAIVD